eukprot:5373072-Pyramimonas_sp.AAC.1
MGPRGPQGAPDGLPDGPRCLNMAQGSLRHAPTTKKEEASRRPQENGFECPPSPRRAPQEARTIETPKANQCVCLLAKRAPREAQEDGPDAPPTFRHCLGDQVLYPQRSAR